MKKIILLGAGIVCFSLIITNAQETKQKELKVGDKAPVLNIQEWIKGEPVTEFRNGQIYVVEFSGTWCPPCLKAIPHLTELAKKYADDVKLISVFSELNDKEKPEDLSYLLKIHTLVNSMGNKMNYIVAAEVPQQTTRDLWNIIGFPTAFIIDNAGRIAWKGNPRDMDSVLAKLTAGTFNAETAINQQWAFSKRFDNILKVENGGDYPGALKSIDSLLEKHPEKIAILYYSKFKLFAGIGNSKAYEWLQFLLDSKIEGFDWPHFIGQFDEVLMSGDRNYLLELKAIDRTIEESETKYHSNVPFSIKAITCAKMGNYGAAIEACKQAIKYSKTPGLNDSDKDWTKRLEGRLITYQYQYKTLSSVRKANKWIMKMIDNKKSTFDLDLFKATLEANKPNYGVMLKLINKALEREENEDSKRSLLNKKIDTYLAIGDYNKAIEICSQLLEKNKGTNNKYGIEFYEKKLAGLKKKAAIKNQKPANNN